MVGVAGVVAVMLRAHNHNGGGDVADVVDLLVKRLPRDLRLGAGDALRVIAEEELARLHWGEAIHRKPLYQLLERQHSIAVFIKLIEHQPGAAEDAVALDHLCRDAKLRTS